MKRYSLRISFVLLSAPLAAALFSAALATTAFAQTPQVTFERVENVSHVASITQDADGFMWFATVRGLARYDGYRLVFYTHDPADSTSLGFNYVEYLYIDREENFWVGTFGGGLDRFDRVSGTFTHFRHDPDDPQSISSNTVTAIQEDRSGNLWVGTHGGLNRLDRESGRFVRYLHDSEDPESLSDNQVRSIYEDRNGTIWIGTFDPHSPHTEPTSGGLNRYDPGTDGFIRYLHDPDDEHSLISNLVRGLYEDSRGRFWVGTWEGGLHLMDRTTGTFTRFRFDPTRPSWATEPMAHGDSIEVGISFVHEDRQGIYWIGSVFGGLDRLDPSTGRTIHYVPDISDWQPAVSAVWTIYESRDGILWIGTWGGLYKLDPNRTNLRIHELDAQRIGIAISLLSIRDDLLWIGTNKGGLVQYDLNEGILKQYVHDPEDGTSIRSNDVWKLLLDRDGILWAGTLKGLDRFDPESGRFRPVRHHAEDPQTLPPGPISALYEDREGALWVGTPGGGLHRLDPDRTGFEHFQFDPNDSFSLSGMSVSAVHQDQSGALWIGTDDGGLSRYDADGGQFTRFMPGSDRLTGISDHVITSLHESSDGFLWIGTRTGGLNRLEFQTGEITVWDTRDDHLSRSGITCILGDEDGTLWISTETRGITHFDPAENTFRNYRLPMTGYPVPGACERGPDGTFFFAAADGFYTFKAADLRQNPVPPQVRLTSFRLAREEASLPPPIDFSQPLRLKHAQNSFTIEFVALHYAEPPENEYRYRLEGYESEWKSSRSFREAVYADVPPGRYTFRVSASNSDGLWNEEGASLAFVILPPLWRTGWAYLMYGLLLIGGIVAIYGDQRRRLIARERGRAAIREADLRAEGAQERAATLLQVDELKSRFFANVSHEFRTPLTLILGPVDHALRNRRLLDERQLDVVQRSARQLLRLINQLLDLSRLDAGHMKIQARRGDVAAFLRRITLSFASQADRETKMLTFSAEPACIRGGYDEDKLEKIVSNLLSNAFKFTPSGGKIALITRAAEDSVWITIRDTGPGIPDSEIPHLFDRFYQIDSTLSRRIQGSGIGLALVKELVELHEGTIAVESQVGFGTSFTVMLPLLDAVDVDAASKDAEDDLTAGGDSLDIFDEKRTSFVNAYEEGTNRDHAPAGQTTIVETEGPVMHKRRPRVLVVEDHDDVRSYVRGLLEEDYEVVDAQDGLDGLAKAREMRPDLMIVDVMMPGIDGLALTRAIRDDSSISDIPVIILTAKADLESRVEGFETGADDYLAKPFDGEELLARVESLIEIRRRLRRKFSDEILLGPDQIVATPDDAAFVDRIRDAIEAHIGDAGFGVELLADEMALSSRQLQRRLKDLTNLSAAGYIRMMRLARAAQLLEQQSGQVSEIADRVGYRDVEHFSRIFKRVYGVPPSAYRRVAS